MYRTATRTPRSPGFFLTLLIASMILAGCTDDAGDSRANRDADSTEADTSSETGDVRGDADSGQTLTDGGDADESAPTWNNFG